MTIGVKVDEPGIGEIVDGNPGHRRGFDIDVATYVARGLGARDIEWYEVSPHNREEVLQGGKVDLIVAGYAISENRMDKITFAGPYKISGQDIMVRASDAPSITGISSLKDKKVCTGIHSTSSDRLVQEFGKAWDIPAHIIRLESIRQCTNALLAGEVDAVSCSNMVLAGYIAEQPNRLHLVGHPFTVDNVGIGLSKDNSQDVALINKILQKMIDDGTWAASAVKHFGPLASFVLAKPPTPGQLESSWSVPSREIK